MLSGCAGTACAAAAAPAAAADVSRRLECPVSISPIPTQPETERIEPNRARLLPPDGNHDIPVFEEVPAGQFVDATPPKPEDRCDAVTQYFWGRAVDVQKVRAADFLGRALL